MCECITSANSDYESHTLSQLESRLEQDFIAGYLVEYMLN